MRYIGCKINLLSEINEFIFQNIEKPQYSFCDVFSGTTSVARFFKKNYKIISNDSLYFSYVLQKAYIENNKTPDFKMLENLFGDIFDYLENSPLTEEKNIFVAENFSPLGSEKRMYFTEENAKRIDFIRNKIEDLKREKKISESEYYYLLASLIEAVPFVSNITGTYGAYLKYWDKRAFNKLELPKFPIIDNKQNNEVYNEDVFDLLKHISGDILYIDPPYNSRQYAPNYHVLETIARYDNPVLSGVTGMRSYEDKKSVFCSKNEVNDAFAELIDKADFSHIIVSYSSSGLMSEEYISKTLKDRSIDSRFSIKKIPYRKYKSKISDDKKVFESLYYIQKKKQSSFYEIKKDYEVSYVADSAHSYSRYIKSPLNYIGGKYKLLPQILPFFPKKIETFVDLFCGGCNVGVNAKCSKIIFNDMNSILTEMFVYFKNKNIDDLIQEIESIITEWNLSSTNNESFIKFRNHYNQTKNPIELYVLSCFSFNYQFRFNNNHEYNNPFGRNRSKFSEAMKNNLIRFVEKIQSIETEFTSYEFEKFPFESIGQSDFVYLDPPYLITTGSYNDGNRGFKDWTEESEKKLYELLDSLNDKKIKFALSNVLEHKGKKNKILSDWSEKYTVLHLNKDYSNSSYNTKRMKSDEVLIINYLET